jgi:hypothetical protein
MLLCAGAALCLALLAYLALSRVHYNVPRTEVVGTYVRADVPFLKVAEVPGKLELSADGNIVLYASDGAPVFSGTWTWDVKEGVVRVDDHRWDRQIRLRSTFTGPRLAMRISTLSFEEDHPEHDEEVDLIKVDPS